MVSWLLNSFYFIVITRIYISCVKNTSIRLAGKNILSIFAV